MNASEWATQVAAPVTTFLIVIGIIVVRGTTVSQFRQKWIDDQRTDVAVVLSYSARKIGRNAAIDADDLIELDLARNRILLREKPETEPGKRWLVALRKLWHGIWGLPWGPEWGQPLDTIKALRDAAATTGLITSVEANQQTLIAQCRMLLKREWNRTRNGELGYRVLLLSAASLTLISVLPAVVDWAKGFVKTPPSGPQRSIARSPFPAVVLRSQACTVIIEDTAKRLQFRPARCLQNPAASTLPANQLSRPAHKP